MNRSQERRMEAQRGYGETAAEAAQRIKDKNAWSEINEKRPLNVPEIAIIIQEAITAATDTLPRRMQILARLLDFYDVNDALEWFNSPQKLLGGETPKDLCESGEIEKVEHAIGQLTGGVHI